MKLVEGRTTFYDGMTPLHILSLLDPRSSCFPFYSAENTSCEGDERLSDIALTLSKASPPPPAHGEREGSGSSAAPCCSLIN